MKNTIDILNNFKIYDLPCFDSRKSFYGKAKVIIDSDGDMYLQSYDTVVCAIVNKLFVKLWDGYSATTMRHINSFCAYADLWNCGGKALWDKLQCDKGYTHSELLAM